MPTGQIQHQVFWHDPFGVRLPPVINDFIRLEVMRGEGKVGWMELDLDPSVIDPKYIKLHARLEDHRSVGALPAKVNMKTAWFIADWETRDNEDGTQTVWIKAGDNNYAVFGDGVGARIVPHYVNDPKALKTGVAIDDAMKAIVREQCGALVADATRDLTPYGFSVQADQSLAPTTTASFSHMKVIDALNKLAAESLQKGTYLTWDIVWTSPTTMEFQTFVGQRGVNRGAASGNALVVGKHRGNLKNVVYGEHHSDEVTFVYAEGSGAGVERPVVEVPNTNAMGLSPWNRREAYTSSNSKDANVITGDGQAYLTANRARKFITGSIVDSDGCYFGVDYDYGDIVCAEAYDVYGNKQSLDGHVNATREAWARGEDTLDNQVRAEA